MERILILVIALGVLSLGFGVVEKLWPQVRGQRRLRAGVFVDVAWWLFTPTIGKLFTGIVVGGSVLGLAAVLGLPLTPDHLRGISERDTLIGRQPFLLQFAAFLFLADLLAYWNHRAFHSFGRLWRIHAVHHSSTELDWLSSVRVHPLNDAIGSAVVATPLLLLGFAPAALAAYLPFLTLYAIMLHANVDWSFGPLRNLIASPAYHRWHHAAEQEALDKDFAGLFPFLRQPIRHLLPAQRAAAGTLRHHRRRTTPGVRRAAALSVPLTQARPRGCGGVTRGCMRPFSGGIGGVPHLQSRTRVIGSARQ